MGVGAQRPPQITLLEAQHLPGGPALPGTHLLSLSFRAIAGNKAPGQQQPGYLAQPANLLPALQAFNAAAGVPGSQAAALTAATMQNLQR